MIYHLLNKPWNARRILADHLGQRRNRRAQQAADDAAHIAWAAQLLKGRP